MLPLKNTKLTNKQKDRLRQRKITMKEVNKAYYTMLNPKKQTIATKTNIIKMI